MRGVCRRVGQRQVGVGAEAHRMGAVEGGSPAVEVGDLVMGRPGVAGGDGPTSGGRGLAHGSGLGRLAHRDQQHDRVRSGEHRPGQDRGGRRGGRQRQRPARRGRSALRVDQGERHRAGGSGRAGGHQRQGAAVIGPDRSQVESRDHVRRRTRPSARGLAILDPRRRPGAGRPVEEEVRGGGGGAADRGLRGVGGRTGEHIGKCDQGGDAESAGQYRAAGEYRCGERVLRTASETPGALGDMTSDGHAFAPFRVRQLRVSDTGSVRQAALGRGHRHLACD